MMKFAWEGRTRKGASVSGETLAETKDAAIARVQSQGVVVSKIDATGETDGAPVERPGGESPRIPSRPGESWRDKVFYLGVAAVFLAIGAAAAYVAPVLRYDCARDAGGATSCTIGRRMYGFIPLPDVRIADLASVEIKGESVRPTSGNSRDRPTAQDWLILASKDGGRWQSHPSSWPFGSSNSRVEQGIRDLLDGSEPAEFHAWIAEGVPTLLAVAFFIPTGLILLSLLVRLVVPLPVIEAKLATLERDVDNRRRRRSGRGAIREPRSRGGSET
jgi:hypothetical protein